MVSMLAQCQVLARQSGEPELISEFAERLAAAEQSVELSLAVASSGARPDGKSLRL